MTPVVSSLHTGSVFHCNEHAHLLPRGPTCQANAVSVIHLWRALCGVLFRLSVMQGPDLTEAGGKKLTTLHPLRETEKLDSGPKEVCSVRGEGVGGSSQNVWVLPSSVHTRLVGGGYRVVTVRT